jgi:transcriptional regulator of heat shock response
MIPKSVRDILNDHKSDIERLKSRITDRDSIIKKLEQEVQKLHENSEKLVEKTVEIRGNWKNEFPTQHTPTQHTQYHRQPIATIKPTLFNLSELQYLILLQQGKADSTFFAVSPMQLKLAYGLEKSERTIRNKLLELEYRGFINGTGARPKRYYLTKEGTELIDKQRRNSISFDI